MTSHSGHLSASNNDEMNPSTETSTLAPSVPASVTDYDEKRQAESDRNSTSYSNEPEALPALEERKTRELDAVALEEELEKTQTVESVYEYPQSWKLAIITIALCMSVFCMALGKHYPFHSLYIVVYQTLRKCVVMKTARSLADIKRTYETAMLFQPDI